MNSIQLEEKRDSILDKIEATDALSKAEGRAFTDEETKSVESYLSEVEKLDKEITLAKKMENLKSERASKVIKKDQRTGEEKEIDNVSAKFSIGKAVKSMIEGREFTGAEADIASEGKREYQDSGLYPKGFVIPRNILDRVESRTDIDQNTSAAQGTDLDGYAKAIRENAVYSKVGINFRKAVGDVKTNIVTGMNWGWVAAENTAASDIGANTTSVTAAPAWGRGYVDVSKTMLAQNPDSMAEFMADLGVAEANFFDAALFASSSVSNAPACIAAKSGVLTFTEASSYAASTSVYSDFVKAIQTLGVNNAMSQNLKFVANALLFSELFKSAQVASVNQGMTGQTYTGQMVAGYPTVFSNHPADATTSADVIAGDFSTGVKAYQWGGLDIFIDPYSVSLNDQVRIVGHKRVSWVIPQGGRFVKFTSLFA